MSRFCVVTLALCAASLLALQFFISLTPVHAQASPSVTIVAQREFPGRIRYAECRLMQTLNERWRGWLG